MSSQGGLSICYVSTANSPTIVLQILQRPTDARTRTVYVVHGHDGVGTGMRINADFTILLASVGDVDAAAFAHRVGAVLLM